MVAGDFRKGVTIEIDGKVYMVVDFQHVKPGKGAAFVRTKLKNVVTGQVLEQTFNPTDKYPDARIERKEMQYSYNDGNLYYFMDMDSFDMLPLNYDMVAVRERGNDGDDSALQGRSVQRRSPELRRARGGFYRARHSGRYLESRQQACYARNRLQHSGAAFRQYRRQNPRRHAHRNVHGAREVKLRAFVKISYPIQPVM